MRRFATPFIVALALVVVLLDATVWRWLGWLGAQLGRLSFFAWLERIIAHLSPGMVIAVFVLPFVPIIPLLKLGELWLLAHHHYVAAVLVIIGSKVVGAAFSTRIFAIARPKMLQVAWFAAAYVWVTGLLARGHAALQAWPAWVATRTAWRRLVLRIRGHGTWSRRWLAARRLARRQRSLRG